MSSSHDSKNWVEKGRSYIGSFHLIFSFILSLIVLLFLSFALMISAPGDPFMDEQGIPQELLDAMKKSHGLDQPILVQFTSYLDRVVRGDLGHSIRSQGDSVSEIIERSFPISLQLGLQAFLVALPLGTIIGLATAYLEEQKVSALSSLLLTVGISIPTFVAAALLQHLLAIFFPIFPVARWDSFFHTILPTVTLAIIPTTSIARIIRTNTLEVMNTDFVTFARIRGLKESFIARAYILPNAWLPCLQYLGPTFSNMLFGSFAVEKVFGIPGLGQWYVTAIMTRDYPVIAGLTAFYSILLFTVSACIQILSRLIDTRLRT